MPPLQGVILQAGGNTFSFRGDLEVNVGVRTGYILDGSGSTWTALFSEFLNDIPGFDVGLRQGIFLDLGGGEHIIEVEAKAWTGSDLAFGGAAGADPVTQMGVLENTLVETQIDSFSPATIEVGEFSSQGRYSPLSVVIEGPRISHSTVEPSTIDVNFVAIETATFDSDTFMDALSLTG